MLADHKREFIIATFQQKCATPLKLFSFLLPLIRYTLKIIEIYYLYVKNLFITCNMHIYVISIWKVTLIFKSHSTKCYLKAIFQAIKSIFPLFFKVQLKTYLNLLSAAQKLFLLQAIKFICFFFNWVIYITNDSSNPLCVSQKFLLFYITFSVNCLSYPLQGTTKCTQVNTLCRILNIRY